ncbi:MAG: AraC family transcriptional regulator [Planctomycetes bacterium]|nr:AraC family transcriptional regulator [Planctomycetota bacterium]
MPPFVRYELDATALPRVVRAGFARDAPGRHYPEHALEHLEIDYISSGVVTWRVDGAPVDSRPGHAYLFLPGEQAEGWGRAQDGPYHCRWLRFTWPVRAGRKRAPDAALGLPRAAWIRPDLRRAFERDFDAAIELCISGRSNWELAAGGHLLAMLCAMAVGPEAAPRAHDRRLSLALAYIERNLARPMKIAEVAGAAGFSAVYFTELFRRMMNVSPLQYLIEMRLQESRRLLASDPRLSVGEAARRVGFRDAKYFATAFRTRYGLTPRAFRRGLDRLGT